ncbi:MAG: transferrin-binding protein-like solute binding protein [Formosimonas sp.]
MKHFKLLGLALAVAFVGRAQAQEIEIVSGPVTPPPSVLITDTTNHVQHHGSTSVIYNASGVDTQDYIFPWQVPRFSLNAQTVVSPGGFMMGSPVYQGGYVLSAPSNPQAVNTVTVGSRSDVVQIQNNALNINKFAVGRVTYSGGSYSRYGAWNVNNITETIDCTASSSTPCGPATIAVTPVSNGLFAGGSVTPTAQMPRGGRATYTGNAIRSVSMSSVPMTVNVNFGSRVLTGTSGSNASFGDALRLNGLVLGNGFVGLARSGSAIGGFSGNFYGPAAQELAGQAQFSNASLNAAFGGSR